MAATPSAHAGVATAETFNCGYDATANTFWPVADVLRTESETGELRVAVQLALFDGDAQVATLGTGKLGSGSNGTVDVPVNQTVSFRPEAGVKFDDDGTPPPGLSRDHDYRIRTRVTDFDDIAGSGGSPEIKFWDCRSACPGLTAEEVLGTAPTSVTGPLACFPNAAAAREAVWVPYIDNDFVPQGLALEAGNTALVSGYLTPGRNRCRVLRVDLSTGQVTGSSFSDPDVWDSTAAECNHGGGIAIDSTGELWLADTHKLILLDREQLFAEVDPLNPIIKKSISLANLDGSFLMEAGTSLYVGDFGRATLYGFPLARLHNTTTTSIRKNKVDGVEHVPVAPPPGPQGGDFAPDAARWIAFSDSDCGQLKRNAEAPLRFGPGVEEIEFAADGSLWAVFEAGTKKYPDPFYPLIARFDPDFITQPPTTEPTCDL